MKHSIFVGILSCALVITGIVPVNASGSTVTQEVSQAPEEYDYLHWYRYLPSPTPIPSDSSLYWYRHRTVLAPATQDSSLYWYRHQPRPTPAPDDPSLYWYRYQKNYTAYPDSDRPKFWHRFTSFFNPLDSSPSVVPTPTLIPSPSPGKSEYCRLNQNYNDGYHSDTPLNSVFAVPKHFNIGNETLTSALYLPDGGAQDGSARVLVRVASAALLNHRNSDEYYYLHRETLISDVNNSLQSGSRDHMMRLASRINDMYGCGCSLL